MMSSNREEELVKFIVRPEKFDTALEISERFPQAVRRLQSKFWSKLEQRLEKVMAQSPKEFKGWECDLTEGDTRTDYFSISLTPKTSSSAKRYCCPCLQQRTDASKFQLFYGIVWSEEVSSEPRIAEYNALKRKVREDLKLTNGEGWWVGGTLLPDCLTKPETLRQLSRDDSLERLQADQLVGLFKDTRELLEKLNQALLKK
jgi:hypothetical protein